MSCAAASVDGLHVAIVRDGELSLYTVEPFAEIARTQLAPHTPRTIAFVGRQILVHDTTRLTVFSMQRLAITAQVELDPPARLLATSQHYALLARDELSIASCTSEGTAIAPTRTPAVVERAVGLENARFLTWAKTGPAEMWDAASRLPIARVGLELPLDTSDVGTTGKHRAVWIATSGGDLITSRLSDGKTTIAALPKPPQRIVSHPASAWLVMDFDGEPHAVNSVLRTWHRVDIPAGRPRALAPSIGAHAYVIVDEGADVARYEVGADAVAPKIVRVPVGGSLPEPDDAGPMLAPTPIARVERARVEVATREPPPTTHADAPSLSARFANRDREPGRMRPIGSPIAPAAAPARPGTAADWHDALYQWSQRVLGDAPSTELPAMQSPVNALADRARLDMSARRILNILYADWLAGHGDVGLAASKLVEIAGPSAWQDALGNGQLGKLGLVTSQVGRCLLARAVGTFFDGREPELVQRTDGAGKRTAMADGCYRTRASHDEIARVVGTIAACDGDANAARLEAWLRAWPIVVGSAPHGELRPGELVIVIGEPAGLPDLPGV